MTEYNRNHPAWKRNAPARARQRIIIRQKLIRARGKGFTA